MGGLFKKNGIDLIEGDATLTAEGDVSVGEQTLAAETVILATGSVPRAIPGVEFGGRVIGTEQAWALPELPARLAVVGAGASGAEIASGFARLGSEVLLLEALDRVLPTEDADISRLVERGPQAPGHRGPHRHARQGREGRRDSVSFSYGDGERRGRLSRDRCRTRRRRRRARPRGGGRRAGRARAGEGRRRTSAPRARASTRSATSSPARRSRTRPPTRASSPPRTPTGLQTHPLAYVDIPRATFCTPNVGSFGLTEAQAREQGYDVVVGKVPYGAVGGGIVYGDRRGW